MGQKDVTSSGRAIMTHATIEPFTNTTYDIKATNIL